MPSLRSVSAAASTDHDAPDDHGHGHGLAHDLGVLAMQRQQQRRQTLRWLGALGAAGVVPLMGCGGGGDMATTGSGSSSGTSSGATSGTSSSGTTCTVVPEETAGPYPGDGSNTANGSLANALALSGIVRSDITSSIDGATGTAGGVPLTLTLTVTNTNASCTPLSGYAIYLWHCDREGRYSMYSSGVTNQNYLRGVQETDTSGQATFITIFPGCYSGRMPHMHFEIYRDANTATNWNNKLKTSQLAFPVATCQTVYNNASGYSASINNLAATSFAQDNVFSDGVTLEMVTITGSVAAGYTAHITVSISA